MQVRVEWKWKAGSCRRQTGCSTCKFSRQAAIGVHRHLPTTKLGGMWDLHLHEELSYEVHHHLAVCPEARASFRPTGRTSMKAVLICQLHAASTCSTAARVPNTTRC